MATLLTSYKGHVEAFAERLLRPYISRLTRNNHRQPASKEINDAVWQTITLAPFEVIILNSPILQRLRSIRQLGVAHWTYPCAMHSRFEHSVGTMAQVQRLVDSLNHHRPDAGTFSGLSKKWVNLLRLAALCHDVGHGFMSHVSENAMDGFAVTVDLKNEFRSEVDCRKKSLSEMAAYFLLGSPAFGDLLAAAHGLAPYDLPDHTTDLLQNAVIGKVIHKQFPLLHELISGPYDADKLDYMTRDAQVIGVPSVTDIPRLVQKVRLVPLTQDKLPHLIAESVDAGAEPYYLTAVALSGARTLDELMLGRTLLFDKAYRHQKVRAAEAMVANIVAYILPALGQRALILPLLLTDEDVLTLDHASLRAVLRVSLPKATMGRVRDLSRRLRERRHFVRAYAFAHYIPADAFRQDPDQRTGLDEAARAVQTPEGRARLLDEIARQLCRMRRFLPAGSPFCMSHAEARDLVALDPPAQPNQTNEIARAYLVTGNNDLLAFKKESAESSGWSNAYLLARDLGYVFAAEEVADAAFLASELVFRNMFGVRTPPTAFLYAKAGRDSARGLRQCLTKAGYYRGCPNDLRAEPARLLRADVDSRIRSIVEKLRAFEGLGPIERNDQTSTVRINELRVRSWLHQFETDDEVDCGLSLLEAMKVISREDIQKCIHRFVEVHSEFRGSFVCPIGSPKDSSSHLTYYVGDVQRAYRFTLCTLSEALLTGNRPILFIDDFIGSGQQLETVLMTWFGRKDEAPLAEDHGPPLGAILRDQLRKRKLAFAFCCGESTGTDRVQKVCKSLGLDAVTFIGEPADALPAAFGRGTVKYNSPQGEQRFKERCASIGRQLLRTSADKRRARKWLDDRALGYGNKAYLLAFPYNTPTQTLTLLWSGGKVDGWEWLPLLPRRPKN